MQGGRVAPVKIGEITITDTGSLQSIFPPAAVETIVKYFPTVGAVPISTIPPEDVPILVDAFKRRITALRSLTGKKVSTITDFKNNKAIREFIKVLAQLETTDSALHGEYRPLQSAKEPRRKLFAKLKPEVKRDIIFRILWDLLHPDKEASAVEDSWNALINYVSSRPPVQIILENSIDPSANPLPTSELTDKIDMGGLTKATAEEGSKVFQSSAVSSDAQLKRLYALSHFLNVDITKLSPEQDKLVRKVSQILNEYILFYTARYKALIGDAKEGLITKFYKNNSKSISEQFELILTIYNIITTIKIGNLPTFINNNYSIMIKVKVGSTEALGTLITLYQKSIQTKKPTNAEVRALGSDAITHQLYNLNTTEPANIKILCKSQINTTDFSIRSIKNDEYTASNIKDLINTAKPDIDRNLNDYFTKDANTSIYLVIGAYRFAHGANNINPIIGQLYEYKDNKIQASIPALTNIVMKTLTYTNLIPENNTTPIINIKYTSDQMFNSFTPAILTLLIILHMRAQISPEVSKKP
uniref:Uncharacterized protein n=1 Tax=viral metagenome TaxID=1070528 RepID=A0A6C0K0J1_9ZZZZ